MYIYIPWYVFSGMCNVYINKYPIPYQCWDALYEYVVHVRVRHKTVSLAFSLPCLNMFSRKPRPMDESPHTYVYFVAPVIRYLLSLLIAAKYLAFPTLDPTKFRTHIIFEVHDPPNIRRFLYCICHVFLNESRNILAFSILYPTCFPIYLGLDLLSHGRVAADVGMAVGLRQQLPHRGLLPADQVLHVHLKNRKRQNRGRR